MSTILSIVSLKLLKLLNCVTICCYPTSKTALLCLIQSNLQLFTVLDELSQMKTGNDLLSYLRITETPDEIVHICTKVVLVAIFTLLCMVLQKMKGSFLRTLHSMRNKLYRSCNFNLNFNLREHFVNCGQPLFLVILL